MHLEIITERLEREFDVNLITTTPGVVYKVNLNSGEIFDLQNPSSLPDPNFVKVIEEPWIKATIINPDQYLGSKNKLCQDTVSYKHLKMPTPHYVLISVVAVTL